MTTDEDKNGNINGNNTDESSIITKLLDPQYPLLAKFRERAPGTYKHCQALASMVEGIAIELKLDVDFMKVLGLYHDIGKSINPLYFSENQIDDENPHDKLDPKISYQIISRHVSDTALILLSDDNFPRDLIKIATQHHGTSVMKYFFNKSGMEFDDYFRYKSEKPTRIESAILMICDCVEAGTRSQAQLRGAEFDPSIIVEDTLNNLMSDGQLDNVYMRLGDLQKIKDYLVKDLKGTYQKRISFDKEEKEN